MPRFVGHIRAEAAAPRHAHRRYHPPVPARRGRRHADASRSTCSPCRERGRGRTCTTPRPRASVTVTVDGAAAPSCSASRRLLYEIVYNLCDNAIKYNRDGGQRRTCTVAADAGGSSITVADTGIGIAPEHQARVFERFYRVDKSHSKASGGTGLGLSIVKHAVQYHHGRIELESTPGTGTTIRVVFPNP
ncbi:MAG: sensor histidine kinase [Oscillospiraceae bacterium]